MSGFVAVCHWDERPVERRQLLSLMRALRTRGPNGGCIWTGTGAGLGLRRLVGAPQPCSLDGEVWVAGDLRLDGRAELRRTLAAQGRSLEPNANEAVLLLHAYAVWGDDCVRQLLGDFSFALWDARKRRLLAARDHFGVRPLYFARLKNGLLVSNTLHCLRRHPEVSERLNEQAIGDFLLFGSNQEPTTTTFADVQRLPPAHVLTASAGQVAMRRYWELSREPSPQSKRSDKEQLAAFREQLQTAVSDRLHAPRTALFMSGGMDSTALAALAQQSVRQSRSDIECRAYTNVYDYAIPDREREYATLAAEALGLPIEFLPTDEQRLFDPYPTADALPEPADDPIPTALYEIHGQVARYSPVALSGFGGDPLLHGSQSYFIGLLKTLRWGRWLAEVLSHLRVQRRWPPLGLRSRLKNWLRKPPAPALPDWLNPEFVERLDLRARLAQRSRGEPLGRHPTHDEAYASLTNAFWPSLFEILDAGATGQPLEVRHPLFDVRLVEFVLALPPLPWCADKYILRESMRGLLPERICRRPKTPLAGDPIAAFLQRTGTTWGNYFDAKPVLSRYANVEQVSRTAEATAAQGDYVSNLLWRPLGLNYWFVHLESNSLLANEEDADDCTDAPAPEKGLSHPEAPGLRDRA